MGTNWGWWWIYATSTNTYALCFVPRSISPKRIGDLFMCVCAPQRRRRIRKWSCRQLSYLFSLAWMAVNGAQSTKIFDWGKTFKVNQFLTHKFSRTTHHPIIPLPPSIHTIPCTSYTARRRSNRPNFGGGGCFFCCCCCHCTGTVCLSGIAIL